MALSKKDLQISITLNELYNTHSLLLQHVDYLVSCFSRKCDVTQLTLPVTKRQATLANSPGRAGSCSGPSTAKRESESRSATLLSLGNPYSGLVYSLDE